MEELSGGGVGDEVGVGSSSGLEDDKKAGGVGGLSVEQRSELEVVAEKRGVSGECMERR